MIHEPTCTLMDDSTCMKVEHDRSADDCCWHCGIPCICERLRAAVQQGREEAARAVAHVPTERDGVPYAASSFRASAIIAAGGGAE